MAGSLILAVSMLAYTGYSSVTTMQCIYSGEQAVYMGSNQSCCDDMDATPERTMHPKCCDVQKADLSFYSFKTVHENLIPILHALPLKQDFTFAKWANTGLKNHFAPFIKDPPLPGKKLLIGICKFTL